MPLTPYKRGTKWWVRGRIEYNGRPITSHYRCSTRSSTESGARDWIRQEEDKVIRHFLIGDEPEALTFTAAVILYPAKPAEARFLMPIVKEIGERLVSDISPQEIRLLAPKLYPKAAADTWKRQVLSPVSAVINNAHQLGRCAPIRIKGYSAQERIAQDEKRGKQSRQQRPAGDWRWLRSVQTEASPWVSAALEFMFETGARIGQAIALTPDDLDLVQRRVWLPAQKGHSAQWVDISEELTEKLKRLRPRRPKVGRTKERQPPRVFGYADRTGFTMALKRACKAAKEPYLTPHEAGRRAFYTELRVRQGMDPITAAKAGRWSDPVLPDRRYAAVEDLSAVRAAIRAGSGTKAVQNRPSDEDKSNLRN